MSLGDTLLQPLFRFIVSTLYGAYLIIIIIVITITPSFKFYSSYLFQIIMTQSHYHWKQN